MNDARALLLALILGACRPSTDLVVAPPPRAAPPPVKIELPAPRADSRLPEGVRPHRYRLALEIDPAASSFRGEVRIELDVDQPTHAIVLHGSELAIDQVELTSEEKRIEGKASFRKAAGAEGDARAEELVIASETPIAIGVAELRIAYHAPLDAKMRGLYRADSGGKSYAFTQLEPADARRMMPCFDDPMFKTPFELSVTAPRADRVFSNANSVRERDVGEDPETGVPRIRVDFAPTEAMPTYLLAIAVGPFDVLEGAPGPVPIRFIAPEGKAKQGAQVLAMSAGLLGLYAERFGRPYPYPKLDLVAVPSFGPGAMENAGLITFREELVLLDGRSTAQARRYALQVVAHELAHQWFGDLVTLRWWDDLWLNEGFASYFESVMADAWRPETKAELEDLAWLGHVMDLDALDAARRVRQPVASSYQAEEAFDAITYAKGAAIIGMIANSLGDAPFRAGIKSYLGRHAGGNAGADDLFRALGDASKKDVAAIAGSFVDQSGVPLVRVTASCEDGKGKLELEQRRYRTVAREPEEALWHIPVCVRYPPRVTGRTPPVAPSAESLRACTVLAERTGSLELEHCPVWILPNDDYRGYYRYALAPDLAKVLWRATGAMDARARIGFLANAWALVQASELPAVDFIAMLGELRGEREREVVELILDLVGRIDDALVTQEARPAFEAWAATLIAPIARELGWDAKPSDAEETKLLRQSVLQALAVHTADPWLYAEAQKRAAAYLRDPASIDPDTATVALRAAVHKGTVSFDALQKALVAAAAPDQRVRVLRAMGSFADDKLTRALDLALDGRVKMAEVIYLTRSAAEWPDSRALLVRWLEAHLPDLAAKSDGMTASGLLSPLAKSCDRDSKSHAEEAFTPLVAKIGGSHRRLSESLEAAGACIDLRRRQAALASAALIRLGRDHARKK